MNNVNYRRVLRRSAVAMVFAHPLHEWFNWGTVLKAQPDIYYLSSGLLTTPDLEASFRKALRDAGFEGTVTFAPTSEREIFGHYLTRDTAWFAAEQERLASWLANVAPDLIYMDAFEWYNSVHDLVPLFVKASTNSSRGTATPHVCREHGTAIYTLNPQQQTQHLAANSGWHRITNSMKVVRSKRKLATRLGELLAAVSENLSDSLHTIIRNWSVSEFETEFYRRSPHDHDYLSPPDSSSWTTYDERGRARVVAGRSEQAITFADHYQPLARLLVDANSRSPKVA